MFNVTLPEISPETRIQRIAQATTETKRLLAKAQSYQPKFQDADMIAQCEKHLNRLAVMLADAYEDLGFKIGQTVYLPAGWDKNNKPNPKTPATILLFSGDYVRVATEAGDQTVTFHALRKDK